MSIDASTPQDPAASSRSPRNLQTQHDGRYDDGQPTENGDVLSGGDASRAPRNLREVGRQATGDAILAGDDWDNPDGI